MYCTNLIRTPHRPLSWALATIDVSSIVLLQGGSRSDPKLPRTGFVSSAGHGACSRSQAETHIMTPASLSISTTESQYDRSVCNSFAEEMIVNWVTG